MEPTVLQVDRLDERHLPRDFGEYLKGYRTRHGTLEGHEPILCDVEYSK